MIQAWCWGHTAVLCTILMQFKSHLRSTCTLPPHANSVPISHPLPMHNLSSCALLVHAGLLQPLPDMDEEAMFSRDMLMSRRMERTPSMQVCMHLHPCTCRPPTWQSHTWQSHTCRNNTALLLTWGQHMAQHDPTSMDEMRAHVPMHACSCDRGSMLRLRPRPRQR